MEEEVCARQDAHSEAFMVDFRSSTDDLNHRQPSMPVSIALIDDDDDDDKDEAIHIILPINDANIKFKDIAVVPFLGRGCPLSTPNMLSAFESATTVPTTKDGMPN